LRPRPRVALGRAPLRRSPGSKVHWTFDSSRLTQFRHGAGGHEILKGLAVGKAGPDSDCREL